MKKMIIIALAIVVTACQAKTVMETSSPLSIQSHVADGAGFHVTSHLIAGEREAILVDAQFTRSQAKKVVEMVKASGKRLTTIFITHGHPDHYFGLEILTKAFPEARAIATPEVVKEIVETAPGKQSYWKSLYGDDLLDEVVIPESFDGDQLTVDGKAIQLVNLGPGESEHAIALYVPELQTLVSGDLIYNQVHLWLAEDRPVQWLKNLEAIKGVGPIRKILPGHGEQGGQELLGMNRDYIQKFLKVTESASSAEEAMKSMLGVYSDFRLPIILELSTKARVK